MFSLYTMEQTLWLSFKTTMHFNHDSGLSPLQRITLCQRVWHHSWFVVTGANYFNGYCCCQPLSTPGTYSLNQFCLSLGLVSCYTISLHHIDHNCFVLELFHTKPPNVKVSDNCGFRYTFHEFYFCTHNLLRVLDLSNLAWGQHS